jgi:diaminobutyrate-2-oxoglutarate transaminase
VTEDYDALAASAEWESSGRSYPAGLPLVFDHAEGAWLFDSAGRRYLDFLTGAGVLLLGHNHPALRAAVAADAAPIVNGLDLLTTAKIGFAAELRAILPGELADTHKIHFCGPTGSDAIEAALKLAALATGRRGVIAFAGSYHGMSQGALAVTSSRRLRRAGLVMSGEVSFCPYPYPLRFPPPYRTPHHSGIGLPGMILLEAVQGEGGTIVPPPEFLRGVAALCARHGVLLAVDEIQAGLGRTGRWFAFEHAGVVPDIIAVSKGIGGGYPMSLLLFHRRLDVMQPGDHVGTFRGQQIAFTAGAALLRTIAAEQLLGRAARIGAMLRAGMKRAAADHPAVAEVRGIGLYLAVELRSREGREAETAGARAGRLRDALLARGVVVETGGRDGAVVRLLPPLTTGEREAAFFLEAFADSLAAL